MDFPCVLSNKRRRRFSPLKEAGILIFDSPVVHPPQSTAVEEELQVRGDLLAAYAAADRRCRSVLSSAHDFLVRARLARALGDESSALADIEVALEREPANFEANLEAMQWGTPEARVTAARRIVEGDEREVGTLRQAIRIQLEGGGGVVYRLRREGEGVGGWLAWPSHEALTLGLEDTDGEWIVEAAPDPSLGLAGDGYSVVEIGIPDVLRVFDPRSGENLFTRRESTAFVDRRVPTSPNATDLTVIVPIYDGFEATKACLESLFAQRDIVFSTILVDDAAPDPQLSALAATYAQTPGVTVLRNEANLGFAGSINRALAISGRDDVALLNADTLLPPKAMARLRALVKSDASVGTATPLSNNSQWTSFPRPLAANALPSLDQVREIDELAFAANGEELVDMPTGIGFCLYVSRACLDATGPLPERYGRGYYEDVEFCMIARQRGFRNVCATGVFVGHAGSVSFKSDKRELSVRNVEILEERFPLQGVECLAFAQADPLKSARAAIEEWLAPDVDCTLIAASEGRTHWHARQRASELQAMGQASILLGFAADGGRVVLWRADEGAPVSLTFMLDESGRQRLTDYLKRLNVRGVEIFDAARTPDALLNALFAIGAPIDLFCVDLWAMRGGPAPRRGACETPLQPQPCRSCITDFGATADPSGGRERQSGLARAISAARSVRSVDRMGAAFAKRIFGAKAAPLESERDASRGRPRPYGHVNPHVLGVLAPIASVEGDRLLVRLSRKLAARSGGFRVVVFGACLNEADVLAAGSTVVVGSGEPEEYVRLARLYVVGRVALFDRTSLFGPLDRLASQLDLPKAYFDWSFGALEGAPRDLVIDPRVCDEKAASSVAFWLNSD